MTEDELEDLDILPLNFYVLTKYMRKYADKNIPLLQSRPQEYSNLVYLNITQAIDTLKETDTNTHLVLNDFGRVLMICEEQLLFIQTVENKSDKQIVLEVYYRNIIRILIELTNVVLFTLWNNLVFNKLTAL